MQIACQQDAMDLMARMEEIMSLISLVVVLIVVGVLLWLVNTYIPMDPKIKQIMNVVVLIVVVLWLLNIFGLLAPLQTIHVGKISSFTLLRRA
jgi:hypothetical protein